MEIVPLGPGFAAELRGVGLADIAADDAVYAVVRAAFEEHSVLVFRDQEVTDEIQLAFSRRFGPPEVTKVGSQGTGSHFVILSTIGPDGRVVPADHRLSLRSKANQLWHTDSSFKRVPALTSILSARIIPARGGETEYVSTRLAFERRPDLYVNYRLWNLDGLEAGKNAALVGRVAQDFGVELDSRVDVKWRKGRHVLNRLYLHFDSRFEWPSPQAPLRSDMGTCHALSSHIGVLSDGTVVPCCLDTVSPARSPRETGEHYPASCAVRHVTCKSLC